MAYVEKLAEFVVRAAYEDLSEDARQQLKIRVLDALGCAIGAVDGRPVQLIRQQVEDFGGAPQCTLIGGERSSPDRAAFFNSALVRYLDYNDSYLAKGETCHPSDNLGAVLAAAEYAGASGRRLLAALAVAYQVQCRLSDAAPVRARGFDHTTQGSFAVAAGVSHALNLDSRQTANALAISGTAFNALRVTRTGPLSNWKGLAYPNTAFGATHAAFLAMRGVSGPLDVFEGNKGFMETISGRFDLDWSLEDLERVRRTIVKKFNAEIHSQSAIEGLLELKREQNLTADRIERIQVTIFDVAYHIIGGGEEGDKYQVHNKEQADHSLPYILAAALLDDQVGPQQYIDQRIHQPDIQELLHKISIQPSEDFSRRFPDEMPCRIQVWLKDGSQLEVEKRDYEGFFTRPMSWDTVVEKFRRLGQFHISSSLADELIRAVAKLETIQVSELTNLLARVNLQEVHDGF